MNAARRVAMALSLALSPAVLAAQEEAEATPPAEEESGWEFNAGIYGYFPPEDTYYGQPTVMADHGALHLEARGNYEGLDTGSVWVGWNFGFGDKLRLDATLMAGGVFGDFTGVAPGYELTVTWGGFELYSEGEWVFDTENTDDDFFYNWAQLGFSPLDWLSFGFASQRTRTYRTGLDVQRGPFIGFSYKILSLAVFVFNPGHETPTVVTSFAVSF
jgi:hypothetical protein